MLTGVLMGMHRRFGWRQALLALVLAAMVVRAFVPSGYMLAPAGEHGSLAIALCTAQGPKAVAPAEQHRSPGKTRPGETPCAFAAAAQLAPPQLPDGLSALVILVHAPPAAGETPGWLPMAAPPPWATGPPLSIQ